jgi:DNA invertase Pin-like site-specific DNA recombinase
MKKAGHIGDVAKDAGDVAIGGRTAVGYVRVSTDMQANNGLSIEAQRYAIHSYCETNSLRLVRIFQDVESGGRADRIGLTEALATKTDVFVALKFDRISRSIRHFCEMYEQHFADGSRELVAIREFIRLDSALGRALVNILLVFAQMEREATGERTREAIAHIHRNGYFFGKVPYGYKAVPAPENPRYRMLMEDVEEQRILSKIKALVEGEQSPTLIADILNAEQIAPPQGERWTKSLVYNLKLRKGWHASKPVNQRNHTDKEVKLRMRELRDRGTTYQGIANILNEEGYLPYKGKKFTVSGVCQLLGAVKECKLLTPRAFCESIIHRAQGERPSYPALARMLTDGGFMTPRGNSHWWPAQVQQLLSGAFDQHYSATRS